MSKFCPNCGTELNDDVAFCANCGTSMSTTEAPVVEADAAAPAQLDIKKYLPKIIAVGIAAVVIILIFSIFSTPGYKKPFKYMEQITNGKVSNVKKLYPKEIWEYIEDEEDMDVKDVKEELKDAFEDTEEYLEEEYGKNIKFKIKDIKKLDTLDEDGLDEIKEEMKDKYGIPASKVKKAYEVEYTMIVKGKDDEDEQDIDTIVIKIGGKWYLYDMLSSPV